MDPSHYLYTAVSRGTLYYCTAEHTWPDGGNQYVELLTYRINAVTSRVSYILPVTQTFARHVFRWRLHGDSLYFLTGFFAFASQDTFALHRIPLSQLARHARKSLTLPRREQFEDKHEFSRAWYRAVEALMPRGGMTKVVTAHYGISQANPLHGALIVKRTGTMSYDMALLPRHRVKCFTYSDHTFAEYSADLRELNDNVGPDWDLWKKIHQDRLEIDEEFWVFGSEAPRYFVTKSGKLLRHAGGDKLEHLDVFRDNGRIVCVIQDADNDKTFAFSQESYLELKAPLKPTPCSSIADDDDGDNDCIGSP